MNKLLPIVKLHGQYLKHRREWRCSFLQNPFFFKLPFIRPSLIAQIPNQLNLGTLSLSKCIKKVIVSIERLRLFKRFLQILNNLNFVGYNVIRGYASIVAISKQKIVNRKIHFTFVFTMKKYLHFSTRLIAINLNLIPCCRKLFSFAGLELNFVLYFFIHFT